MRPRFPYAQRPRHAPLLLAGTALLALTLGCRTSTKYAFLNLIGLSEKPLTVMHVAELDGQGHLLKLFNPFEAYEPLNDALSRELGRKVTPDYCMPFQLEPSLVFGTCDVAYLTPVQLAALSSADKYRVIAAPIDEHERIERPALLLVKADSPLTAVADLKGRAVAFGKPSDGRTHHAALNLLRSAGVPRDALRLELLPLPGSLRHVNTPAEVASQILSGAADAGLVDLHYWEHLPDTAPASEPSRAAFRELGRTEPLPDAIWVAAVHVDDATVAQIREFLVTARTAHPEALKNLPYAGYATPTREQLEAWAARVKSAGVPAPGSQEPPPPADAPATVASAR